MGPIYDWDINWAPIILDCRLLATGTLNLMGLEECSPFPISIQFPLNVVCPRNLIKLNL